MRSRLEPSKRWARPQTEGLDVNQGDRRHRPPFDAPRSGSRLTPALTRRTPQQWREGAPAVRPGV